jgi:hypothetical protein
MGKANPKAHKKIAATPVEKNIGVKKKDFNKSIFISALQPF